VAHTQRGEVTVTGRDGHVYAMKLGIAAICELEKTLDRPVLKLFDELQSGTMRVTTVREFVKAATSETSDDAANQMLENVGITAMLEAMTNSLLATFGVEAAKNGNGKVSDPPTPARKRAGAGSSKPPLN
jgi:hypothetical protein